MMEFSVQYTTQTRWYVKVVADNAHEAQQKLEREEVDLLDAEILVEGGPTNIDVFPW